MQEAAMTVRENRPAAPETVPMTKPQISSGAGAAAIVH
jgi:hypothetical protein